MWEKTTNDVSDALQKNLDRYNPIFMMADSGARGSISQIRQVLLDNHICTEDALDEVLNEYSFKHDFLEDEKPAAEGWLEGYLFPDTYEVYKGNAAVVDTINKMLNNFGNKYDADIKSGAENLGRSMHDIVTIASLIEREAQRDDERARIAGVIYNRLNNSSEFPYLQVDASFCMVWDAPAAS